MKDSFELSVFLFAVGLTRLIYEVVTIVKLQEKPTFFDINWFMIVGMVCVAALGVGIRGIIYSATKEDVPAMTETDSAK